MASEAAKNYLGTRNKIHLDIETIPTQPEEEAKKVIADNIKPPANMSKAETSQEWHEGKGKYAGAKEALIEEVYRKTALDGAYGEVIAIGFAVDDGQVMSFSRANFVGEDVMLAAFFLELAKITKSDFFVGHHIRFDLEFLFKRCVILGINPGVNLNFQGRHNVHFFCTQEAWAGFKGFISQDNLCKVLGVEGKTDLDGSKVYDAYKAGEMDRIEAYVRDDVEKERYNYKRITFQVRPGDE